MTNEKLKYGHYLDTITTTDSITNTKTPIKAESIPYGRTRSATLSQDISLLDLTHNFNPGYPAQRDPLWGEIKTKRVLLKQHLERIAGIIILCSLDSRIDYSEIKYIVFRVQ